MEYSFTRQVCDYEKIDIGNGEFVYRETGSHNEHFTVYVNPENDSAMTITKNGVSKTVKIVNCKDIYQPKVQKTQIKFRGGSIGLLNHIQYCSELYNKINAPWTYCDYKKSVIC